MTNPSIDKSRKRVKINPINKKTITQHTQEYLEPIIE